MTRAKGRALQAKATRRTETAPADSLGSVADDIESAAGDLVNLTRTILNLKDLAARGGGIDDPADVLYLLADYSFRISEDLNRVAERAFAINSAGRAVS